MSVEVLECKEFLNCSSMNTDLNHERFGLIHDVNNMLGVYALSLEFLADFIDVDDFEFLNSRLVEIRSLVDAWKIKNLTSFDLLSIVNFLSLARVSLLKYDSMFFSTDFYEDYLSMLEVVNVLSIFLENYRMFRFVDLSEDVMKDDVVNFSEIVGSLKCLFASRNLQFDVGSCDNLCFIGNKSYFLRAIINLIHNAYRIMDSYSVLDPRVEFSLRVGDGFVVILVSDNGVGVGEKSIKDLVKPGFSNYDGNRIKGQGLGLSVVQRVVDLYGGVFDVFNNEMGGATFSMIFKL